MGDPTSAIDPLGLNPSLVAVARGLVSGIRVNPRSVAAMLKAADEIRSNAWCVVQDTVLRRSRTQLPGLLQQEMAAAQESKAIGLRMCARQFRNSQVLNPEASRGDYNSCQIDVMNEYNDRVEAIRQHDATRHSTINRNLGEIFVGCIVPSSPGDVYIPDQPPRLK